MPYKRVKNVIYHRKWSRWTKKQECKNVNNAKKAIRLLNLIEHEKGNK